MLKILRVFYNFILRQKLLFIVLIVLVVIDSILWNISPYFFKIFIDNLPQLNLTVLTNILLLYIGIRFAGIATNVISHILGDKILFDAAVDARTTIFKYVQDLDFAFHTSKSTGSLISAFKRGDGAFFTLFHAIHHNILPIIVSFFVMVYFMQTIDSRISILVILSFIVSIIVTKFVVAKNVTERNSFNESEDKISGIIVDNMINFETVKLFASENYERDRLDQTFKVWKEKLWKYGNSFRLINVNIGIVIAVSIFGILSLSLNLAVKQMLTIGEFVLITAFVSTFYPRLNELVWGMRDIAKNYADIEKYFGLMDYKIQVKDPAKPVEINHTRGEIEFTNVNFAYNRGRKNAINGINLKVRQGQSIALVGRSGSGKTTLIKLLMRFYDLDEGTISLDTIDIKDFRKSNLRSFIGVVPQEPILFNNTIAYNIGYGRQNATHLEIKAASKLANIDAYIQSLPKKYETEVGERGIRLSGGQKQRLAIARMILSDPDIIIFDEATSHLDSESEKLIQDAFWKASKNKTTIIIAHRLSTVMRADKIVVMGKGKILETGSHNELINKENSLYKRFWSLQISPE